MPFMPLIQPPPAPMTMEEAIKMFPKGTRVRLLDAKPGTPGSGATGTVFAGPSRESKRGPLQGKITVSVDWQGNVVKPQPGPQDWSYGNYPVDKLEIV